MAKKEGIPLLQLNEHSNSGIKILSLSEPSEQMEHYKEIICLPHRHDHYSCFFIESGYFNFTVDFQAHHIASSSLLVTAPGQVHEPGTAHQLLGWGMAFDPRCIAESARNSLDQSLSKVTLLELSPADKDWYNSIFQLIAANEQEQAATGFQAQLSHSLINAFFYKTATLAQAQEATRIQDYTSRSIGIARQFQQLVKEHYLRLKKPAQYAALLHITVSYLNDTVKSVTGFPATWFIQKQVFNEARRLLYYTGKSVKEIAAQLGYEDDKYFIRLFGKTTGSSPAAFRKKHQGR